MPLRQQLRDRSSDPARLRWLLLGVLLALLLPTSVLAIRAYGQLGYESLYRYRLTAENVAQAVESQLAAMLAVEAARGVDQFGFYLSEPSAGGEPQPRSPLSNLVAKDRLAGALGYFQIDQRGRLSSPLLPATQGAQQALDAAERAERARRVQQVAQLLALLAESGGQGPAPLRADQEPLRSDPEPLRIDQELADAASALGRAAGGTSDPSVAKAESEERASAVAGETVTASGYSQINRVGADYDVQTNQRVFDRLVRSRQDRSQRSEDVLDDEAVADTLLLQKGFLRNQKEKKQASLARKLQENLLEVPALSPAPAERSDFGWLAGNFRSLEYLSIDARHFLLFRRWWQADNPVVQGVVVERETFLRSVIDTTFERSEIPPELVLTLTERNEPIRRLDGEQGSKPKRGLTSSVALAGGGELLYRARLPAPLTDLQLVFSAKRIGLPVGGGWIVWSSVVLVGVLLGGFLLIYRVGLGEIARRQTQQNFVSAVSHELKTPLTAIRMYGEMLKSGWVSEEKKPGYYEFIFSESERLSRLISNVLRLSQISRDQLTLSLEPRSVAELMDLGRSKLQSLAAQSEVELHFELPQNLSHAQVAVDDDAILQVLINLVDNAVKFAAQAERQRVEVTAQGLPSNLPSDRQELCLSVRDYGPGVPAAQLGRIFDLFYRGESELTRKTQGTGIGLSLVAELVGAMGGRVEAHNRSPGAQFDIYLPLLKAA